MKKLVILLCAAMMLLCSSVFAKVVTVTGVGASQTEAQNDAMRVAVEQAVGSLIDSQTVVDKSTVLEDNIYATSQGFVQKIDILNTQRSADGGYRVTANVDVDTNPNSKLMNELTRLKVIQVNMRNAKIAVVIPEEHIKYRIPDPAGETAVIKKFLAAGFQNIIDISKDRLTYNQPFNMSAEQLQNFAQSMQADILVVGQAFSEGAGDVGQYINGKRTGVVSCKARLEAKMYIARTGQVIAADGTYGTGVDITESIAAKKALADAGAKMGDYLVEQVLNMYSSNRQQLEMTVIANGINDINTVKLGLNGIPGVKNVTFNNYSGGRGVLGIQYSGSPQTLFAHLQNNVDLNLELQESTFNTITVVVR
ncbi:hypothetical protein [Phascolarctobacterium succinatutens]|uniref:hypothetical protein n=1 Tax=Phascolarctobacterium succinatutens TaxID=626940 RepID=UPI0026EE22E3|nr:hypothetical protein [Phascolarctobacterium succinatutens]